MNIKEFAKKNKLFFVLTIGLIIWIAFLVVAAIYSTNSVIFYDYLEDEDVSGSYSAHIPFLRYLIEPIVGISLYLTFRSYIYALVIFTLYILVRVLYLVLKKKEKGSEKFNLIAETLRDFASFIVKVALLFIVGIAIYYFVGLFTYGDWIKYGMYGVLELGIWISVILILLKLVSILYIFTHSHLKFNYTDKRMKKRELHKALLATKKELTYFLSFTFLLVAVNVLLLTTQLPMYTIGNDLDEDEILIDFHAHTTSSDGWLTPEERVDWYIDHGIDAAVITDHHHTEGALRAQEYIEQYNLDFTMIIGQEYTTEYGIHLNIYGLEEVIIPIQFVEYEDEFAGTYAMTTEDMVEYVKDEGGYVIVNHYWYGDFDESLVPYTLKELKKFGVDGFEIINDGHKQSEEIREYCLDNDLICISASDMHLNSELSSFMKVEVEDADDIDVDSIFEGLEDNDHEAISVDTTPETISFEGGLAQLKEIETFINYLLNLDRYQYLSWILWSLGVYFIIAGVYRKIKSLSLKELRYKVL